jgi:hypothetical protein
MVGARSVSCRAGNFLHASEACASSERHWREAIKVFLGRRLASINVQEGEELCEIALLLCAGVFSINFSQTCKMPPRDYIKYLI